LALKNLHPAHEQRPRRSKLWLWVLLPLLLVAAAEGTARVFVPAKAQETGLREILHTSNGHVTLAPNTTFKAEDGEVRINAVGLRGDLPDESRIKIAVIGGDSVFNGRIANQTRTLCGQLETGSSLNRASTRFQFVNAGLPGMTTETAKDVVKRVLVPAKVEAVVIMVGHADLALIARGGVLPTVSPATTAVTDEPTAPSWSVLWDYLMSSDTAVEQTTSVVNSTNASADELVRDGIKAFAKSLRALVKECRAAKMGVILATEPCVAMSEGAELILARSDTAKSLGLDLVSMARAVENVRSLLGAMADFDRGVKFADLAHMVSEGDTQAVAAGVRAARPPSKEQTFYAAPDAVLGCGLTEAGIGRVAKLIEKVLLDTRIWGAQRNTVSADPIAE